MRKLATKTVEKLAEKTNQAVDKYLEERSFLDIINDWIKDYSGKYPEIFLFEDSLIEQNFAVLLENGKAYDRHILECCKIMTADCGKLLNDRALMLVTHLQFLIRFKLPSR